MSSADDDYFNQEVVKNNLQLIEKIQIFISTISMIATLSVVFILMYRYNKLVEKRRFCQYILTIAIADTLIRYTIIITIAIIIIIIIIIIINSLCYAFGYPLNALCSIQSFISICEFISSSLSSLSSYHHYHHYHHYHQ